MTLQSQIDTHRMHTPLEGEEPPDEIHSSLLASKETTHPPIEMMVAVQTYIDSLDENVATFKRKEIAEDEDFEAQAIPHEQLLLAGSWPTNPLFTSGSSTRWVNPTYKFATRYSDCSVKCECGAIVTRGRRKGYDMVNVPVENPDEHKDCRVEWQYVAWAQLHANRRKAIIDSLRHGYSVRWAAGRLGVGAEDTASHIARSLDIDIRKHKDFFMQAKANTAAELLIEYPPSTIAKAYGVQRRNISKVIDQYTPYTASEFYEFRRNQG